MLWLEYYIHHPTDTANADWAVVVFLDLIRPWLVHTINTHDGPADNREGNGRLDDSVLELKSWVPISTNGHVVVVVVWYHRSNQHTVLLPPGRDSSAHAASVTGTVCRRSLCHNNHAAGHHIDGLAVGRCGTEPLQSADEPHGEKGRA